MIAELIDLSPESSQCRMRAFQLGMVMHGWNPSLRKLRIHVLQNSLSCIARPHLKETRKRDRWTERKRCRREGERGRKEELQ